MKGLRAMLSTAIHNDICFREQPALVFCSLLLPSSPYIQLYFSPNSMAEFSTLLHLALVRLAVAFFVYESLAGLSEREINSFVASNGVANIPNPPGPLAKGQDGLKLVNDAAHPFIPAGPNDVRGPYPDVLSHICEEGYA
ncbi:hypothetical protein M422DRAFT_249404 [Sphaerobolus stellatus SS14]|uniref:Uncharacterized protein n=1 Tax=Sphaerobolus stellatus (strain SS14) TaxID=990650 RepID=A0A0C9W5L5_SPHS4|nr:hypothetical protein M422DRAFT_249404 [Sphaerobolus stellatus SS14]